MEVKSGKNVLFLASWYPSKENSTLGNFVQKHAELANEVAKVDVLYAVESDSVEEITIDDNIINELRTVIVYFPSVKSKTPLIRSVIKREAYLLALKKGFRYLDKSYSLVHLNAVFPGGIFAKWLKKKYKVPYLTTVHWTGFLENHNEYGVLPFYLKRSFKSIFKGASKVFVVSDHLGKSLQKLELIKKYSVLNNVVKSDYFYPEKRKSTNSTSPRFLHISTFNDKHKNISGMLSAFGQLKKDFSLHLITEGDVDDVWLAIENYKIPKEKCKVESRVEAREIGEAMRKADCLVLFSNYETFSVVLAEAWTCGLPAIYSQCGGLTEINNPTLGVQVKVKDRNALIEAMEHFSLNDYDVDAIYNFSDQFSEDNIKKELEKAYLTFSK